MRKVQIPVELIPRGEKTRITVTVADNSGKVHFKEQAETADRKLVFNPMLTLEPGYNHVEWKAMPVDAIAEAEALETRRESRNLECLLERAQVTITLRELSVGPERLDLTKVPQPVRVQKPSFTLSGEIRSTQPLKVATIAIDSHAARPCEGFVKGANQLVLRETITLEPGHREIALSAEAADGTRTTVTRLRVDYVPSVPEVGRWNARTLEGSDGYSDEAVILIEGRNQPKIRIDADLNMPAAEGAPPFAMVAVLDDVEQKQTHGRTIIPPGTNIGRRRSTCRPGVGTP